MRLKYLIPFILSSGVLAQTINPNQIRPAANNGYVLTTVTANQPPTWQPGGGGGCTVGTPAHDGEMVVTNGTGCTVTPNFRLDGIDPTFNQTLQIFNPAASSEDDIILTSHSVDSTLTISPTSIHYVCDVTGSTETGCNLHMDVSDGDATTPGLNPIWLEIKPSQNNAGTAGYEGILVAFENGGAITATTVNAVGAEFDMPTTGTFKSIYGNFITTNGGATSEFTTEEVGLIIGTSAATPSAGYCDIVTAHGTNPGTRTNRISLGCGTTDTSTFAGPVLIKAAAPGSGTDCLQIDTTGAVSNTGAPCGSGSGAVNSVSNSDSTLTISPTSGAVVASLNLAHGNTWTANQVMPGLTINTITGSTQCLHVNSSGVVSGTGSDCGAGGGGVTSVATTGPITGGTITTTGTIACPTCAIASSLTANYIPKISTSPTLVISHIDDGATTASTVTITEATVIASGGVSSGQFGTNLFAALPSCAGGTEGTIAVVTDSTTNTWGATITGSGTNHVMAYCDATNWTVMAK